MRTNTWSQLLRPLGGAVFAFSVVIPGIVLLSRPDHVRGVFLVSLVPDAIYCTMVVVAAYLTALRFKAMEDGVAGTTLLGTRFSGDWDVVRVTSTKRDSGALIIRLLGKRFYIGLPRDDPMFGEVLAVLRARVPAERWSPQVGGILVPAGTWQPVFPGGPRAVWVVFVSAGPGYVRVLRSAHWSGRDSDWVGDWLENFRLEDVEAPAGYVALGIAKGATVRCPADGVPSDDGAVIVWSAGRSAPRDAVTVTKGSLRETALVWLASR